MFRFVREKVLPLFLEREITVYKLAQLSGVSHRTCQRAISGEKVSAPIIARLCKALGISYNQQAKYIVGA